MTSGKTAFDVGDILFGKLRPYFHKVGVAPVSGISSTDIVVVKPRIKEWFGYVLGVLSSEEFVATVTAASTGTRMPRTRWRDMSAYEIALPPAEVAGEFTAIVQHLVDAVQTNVHQNRQLASARVLLLPVLLDGHMGAS